MEKTSPIMTKNQSEGISTYSKQLAGKMLAKKEKLQT
jgi:hypothetical protein